MFLIIICLGGMLIMWSVLANLGLKSYKNPFGRRALLAFVGTLSIPIMTFFIGYVFSFWRDGNFIIASMINSASEGFGYHFEAGTLLNIILESLLPIVLFIFSSVAQKSLLKRAQSAFEIKEERLILTENGTKIEIDRKMLFQIFRFDALLMLFVQLLLFRFVAYPQFYPLSFNAILCTAAIFLAVYGALALMGLKIIAVESLIQGLFYGNGDEEVIDIFEAALNDEKVLLEAEQLTPKVEEFILMGIFKTSQSVKNNLFPNASTVRLIIGKGHLDLYEKYKGRAIRRSLSPCDFKRFKSTSKLQIPFINPTLLKE